MEIDLSQLYSFVFNIARTVEDFLYTHDIQVPTDVLASNVILVCTILEVAIGFFVVFLVLKACYYVYKLFRGLF